MKMHEEQKIFPEEKSETINEDKGEQKEELQKKFDALIVLGRAWQPAKGVTRRGIPISLEGKMRTLAAGEMFRAGLAEKIIFSGGKTAGQSWDSEAGAMVEYLKKKFPDIPKELVFLEEESFDTTENAENIKLMLEKYGVGEIALLTNVSHLARAKWIFEHEGFSVKGFSAEEVLKQRSSQKRISALRPPNYEQFVEKYLHSGGQTLEKVKEAILRGMLIVDTKGKIPRFIASRTRRKHSDM